MSSTAELEEQIDQLYAAPLDEFTARRNELAKALRAGGAKAEAEEVRQLAKPTLPAWVVNQLTRRERRDVDLLLDAGHRLRRTQVAGAASREQLDEAVRAERAALQRLLPAARGILAERGSEPSGSVLERVSRTLRAASASDEGRELLARGRLTSELEAPGFDLLAGLATARPKTRPKEQATEPGEKRPTRRAELQVARKRVDEAATRARTAKKELTAAERELVAARREEERLEKRASELRAELDAAEQAHDDAREELRRLQRRSG